MGLAEIIISGVLRRLAAHRLMQNQKCISPRRKMYSSLYHNSYLSHSSPLYAHFFLLYDANRYKHQTALCFVVIAWWMSLAVMAAPWRCTHLFCPVFLQPCSSASCWPTWTPPSRWSTTLWRTTARCSLRYTGPAPGSPHRLIQHTGRRAAWYSAGRSLKYSGYYGHNKWAVWPTTVVRIYFV